jgi:ATP-dependent Clp protease ATP-binding subunit ClpA
VIQEHIKKPLAEEMVLGALKEGGSVRVLVEEKGEEKVLGFEYIKPDTPIRPRDPEDIEPEGEGQDGGGPKRSAKDRPAKPRGGGKGSARKSRTAKPRSVGTSLVPKVPLGSK